MISPYGENIRVVVLTVGLPGSGKTTWAKQLVASEPRRWKRINRDDIRLMMHDHLWSDDHEKENAVTRASDLIMKDALDHGHDVVIDNTNVNGSVRSSFRKFAKERGNTIIVEKLFECSGNELFRRNDAREKLRQVPDDVLRTMIKRYNVNEHTGRIGRLTDRVYEFKDSITMNVERDPSLPRAVVCDIDGTFSFLNDRDPFIINGYENDVPNDEVITFLKTDIINYRHVIFVTARPEHQREETIAYIESHFDRPYELHMRFNDDRRPSADVKRSIYINYLSRCFHVDLVLEDQPSVVRMWRSLGIPCWQVSEYHDR